MDLINWLKNTFKTSPEQKGQDIKPVSNSSAKPNSITKQTDLFGEPVTESTDTQTKIKALDELFARSAKYKTGSDYLELLQFINKFPALSPFNAFLIHMQNRGVSIVMSAAKWQTYKRVPKLNSRPLIILVPFGPVEFVYDISDTEGDEVPASLLNPFHTKGTVPLSMLKQLIVSIKKDGLGYEEYVMHKSDAGYAQSKRKDLKVSINSTMNAEEKFSTIIHELAHIYCGHIGINDLSWWNNRSDFTSDVMEIEAESIAYLVCGRFNLVTSSDSYLSDYIKKHTDVNGISLDTILVVAGYIESMLKPGFRSKSKKNK